MQPFNGLTVVVLSLKKRFGEEETIEIMKEVFSSRLKGVYDFLGFEKDKPEDFVELLERMIEF